MESLCFPPGTTPGQQEFSPGHNCCLDSTLLDDQEDLHAFIGDDTTSSSLCRFIPMKTPMSSEIVSNWSLEEPPKHVLTIPSF